MMAKILTSKKFVAFLVLAVGSFMSYQIFARAAFPGVTFAGVTSANAAEIQGTSQTSAQGITFPVPELGGCASKEGCMRYCNSADHMEACVKFAEKHGLMNKDEAERARKFKGELSAGGGPGGCKSPDECQTFCSNIKNIEACVNFAKAHGLTDKHVDEGEKILAYIKSGGKLPGGCTSEENCKQYCSDFSHAEECFEFAKKAGITQLREREGVHGREFDEENLPSDEQFKKFLELAKKGETPGGCKTKEACENYCEQDARREECLAFGEKVGFIKHEQAEKIRKDGFKGPGGCSSPDSCRDYCNDPAHREACFKFAEDHGFVSREEVTRAKEGFARVRAGFEDAPDEVKACLKSVLGPNIIGDIQSGKLVPGPEIGEKVKNCFEKFGRRGEPSEFFEHAPPEVVACVKEKLGADFDKIKSGKSVPTPEAADSFRVCFEKFRFNQSDRRRDDRDRGDRDHAPLPGEPGQKTPRCLIPEGCPGQEDKYKDKDDRFEGGPGADRTKPLTVEMREFLRSAPPGVADCLKNKLGDDFLKVQSGAQIKIDAGQLRNCFEEFRPVMSSPTPLPQPGQPSQHSCLTRPACLDQTPRCLVPEPAGGWCPPRQTSSQAQPSQPQPTQPTWQPPPSFSPEVIECVRQRLGDAAAGSLKSGVFPGDNTLSVVKQCFGAAPTPSQPSQPTGCIGVITPARDPRTGVCKEFPTPCEVPPDWIRGCEKRESSTYNAPPSCNNIYCIRYDPVCGVNGKTYGCGAMEAACNGVKVAYPGVCRRI